MNNLITILLGIVLTILYDVLIHGISSHNHFILNKIYRNNPSSRKTSTKIISPVGWHTIADVFQGLFLSVGVIVINNSSPVAWLVVGVILGGLMAFQWIHVYADNEIKRSVALTLGIFVFVKAGVVCFLIGLIYYKL